MKKKHGGRKKGIPNRVTFDLEAKIQLLGMDPLENLVKLLPELTPDEQVKVYLGIMPYLYPKRKMIELSPEDLERLAQIKMLEQMSAEDLRRVVNHAHKEGKEEIEVKSST